MSHSKSRLANIRNMHVLIFFSQYYVNLKLHYEEFLDVHSKFRNIYRRYHMILHILFIKIQCNASLIMFILLYDIYKLHIPIPNSFFNTI